MTVLADLDFSSVRDLTAANRHTEARARLAQIVGWRPGREAFEGLLRVQTADGFLHEDVRAVRDRLDAELLRFISISRPASQEAARGALGMVAA